MKHGTHRPYGNQRHSKNGERSSSINNLFDCTHHSNAKFCICHKTGMLYSISGTNPAFTMTAMAFNM